MTVYLGDHSELCICPRNNDGVRDGVRWECPRHGEDELKRIADLAVANNTYDESNEYLWQLVKAVRG